MVLEDLEEAGAVDGLEEVHHFVDDDVHQLAVGFKGGDVETLQFTVPGGKAARYLNLIPGSPTFTAGHVAVLFLTARGARLPITTGLTQGVYRVQQSGGEMMVMPPLVDAAGARVVRGDVRRKPVPLSAFEASVRAMMDAAK